MLPEAWLPRTSFCVMRICFGQSSPDIGFTEDRPMQVYSRERENSTSMRGTGWRAIGFPIPYCAMCHTKQIGQCALAESGKPMGMPMRVTSASMFKPHVRSVKARMQRCIARSANGNCEFVVSKKFWGWTIFLLIEPRPDAALLLAAGLWPIC